MVICMNNEFQTVGLYDHNAESSRKIKKAFTEENIVAIVHATGTGKSYNALQLAYDNKDKKIIYVVPSNGIIEHLKKIINDNPNLDMARDFPNLEFRTYQSFTNMSLEEIKELNVDMLILDEFHHIGAPVWGARINSIIETHPGIKVFGMTAYTVRDRGTSYERDMADPDGNELFSNKVVSRYDLCDAMIDGVLPKPIYKSAYVKLLGVAQNLEEKVQKLDASSHEYQEYMSILSDVKKRIQEAQSIGDVVKKNLKKNGKYIYFCPPCSEEGVNDMKSIISEAKTWALEMGLKEEEIEFYQTTSEMGVEGKKNREAFYNDTDLEGNKVNNKLRIMFAINQYNEGIHAPNVDGVIMGRGTTSDIVYFEQLGRALSVRGETKERFEEYEKLSLEELLELCGERDIIVKEGTPKEEIIEKLLAPVIIDLTNNFEFIKELENNLKNRIKQVSALGLGEKRQIKIRDALFDIEIENQDLFETLRYVSERLTKTWEDMYEYAKKYYEHHGNLEVPHKFKTNNGYEYEESGLIKLGYWISTQRKKLDYKSERGQLLLRIGMRFENKISTMSWEEMYTYAKKYYDCYDDLEVPQKFKTNNGYEYYENGIINLGTWISTQRRTVEPESERGQLLLQIGMRFENKRNIIPWEEMYEYAKKYYEYYDNLEVPARFKTNNGYDYDENGIINLGTWIVNQRNKLDPESERGQLLFQIGMRFENKKMSWEEIYAYAKKYYEHHGNLEVPARFKTNNGYDYDENGIINLGIWMTYQRRKVKSESERGQLLSQIGMRFENKRNIMPWEEMYIYAKKYYEYHGNLEVSTRFKTNNGYEYDENGIINLGQWVVTQRKSVTFESERGQLLSQIGMRFENKRNIMPWEEMYIYVKKYYEYHGNLEVSTKFKTNNGYEYDENGIINLGTWISTQRRTVEPESERGQLLSKIGMVWSVRKNKEEVNYICNQYNIDTDMNKEVLAHIPIQELSSKISYLEQKGINIVDEKGNLHEIFSMSNINMQSKYDISLEELIDKYYVSSIEKRGK